MKKYTNKILIALGIIILICNIVFISSTMSRLSKYSDNTKEVYDEYYYNDTDYPMNEE
jgi:hypothetical protein